MPQYDHYPSTSSGPNKAWQGGALVRTDKCGGITISGGSSVLCRIRPGNQAVLVVRPGGTREAHDWHISTSRSFATTKGFF